MVHKLRRLAFGLGLVLIAITLATFLVVNQAQTLIQQRKVGTVTPSVERPYAYRVRGWSAPVYLSRSEYRLVNAGFWCSLLSGVTAGLLLMIGRERPNNKFD
jgi:hypothetical protein